MNDEPRRVRASIPHATLAGNLTGNARRDPLQANEQMGSDGYPDSPGPVDLDPPNGEAHDAATPVLSPATRDPARNLPDAFAEKTANTLDMATANILERIRGIKTRCEKIETALTREADITKQRIRATVQFASRAEELAGKIDAELDAIVVEHNQGLRQ